MSKRDEFRAVQTALNVPATGIPNDATKNAFSALWDAALTEYRTGEETGSGGGGEVQGGTLFTIKDGWLAGARKNLISGGRPLLDLRALVIHFTAGATAESSVEYWRNRGDGVCAHLIVDRNGLITQCRPFNLQCGHAGVSRWVDPIDGRRINGMNSASIGIEIANAGEDDAALKWARKQPGFASIRAKHRNGGPEVEWEAFPSAQLLSVFGVAQTLVKAFSLHDVTGHDCIAPERKTDPGPAFPMERLREACGFKGLPQVFRP